MLLKHLVLKVIHTFALALTVSVILIFQIFYIKKVGQGLGVQLFSMPFLDDKYQNLSKLSHAFFALALTVSGILTLKIVELQKVGQCHGVQFSHSRHSMANIKIYKSRLLHF